MELRYILLVLGLLVSGIWATVGVHATSNPLPPTTLTQDLNATFNPGNYQVQSTLAIAGNISRLMLTGISQTKSWQGYYGNITGSITLDDANNFTFYNWTNANPRGQIYATLNNSITWDQVGCFNFTGGSINETTIADYYNISSQDADNVNLTFNQTDHQGFTVGAKAILGCPTTYIFQNDAYQQANFVNVLLWDQSNNQTGWIYTTLIENKTPSATNNLICYNGETCDFQMLVNENGHGTDVSTTTYYFWVELL